MTWFLRRRVLAALIALATALLFVPVNVAHAAASPAGAHRSATVTASTHRHKPKAPKPVKPGPGHQPAPVSAAPPATDISAAMPRTMRDEITGDFLGLGYDQRMRVEGSNLNIYAPPSRGGKLLQSTPTDLAPAPDDVTNFNGGPTVHTWAEYTQEQYEYCPGCSEAMYKTFHFNTVYLADNGQNVFIAGTQGSTYYDSSDPGPHPDAYSNVLYEVPRDGSCASASCAQRITLPSTYRSPNNIDDPYRVVGPTSLAAGYVNGHPYLAVGLSDFGVQIYDVSGAPRLVSGFGGMATPDHSQTPVTALAWDPSGSGLLAVGVASWGSEGFFVNVNDSGVVQPGYRTWTHSGGWNLELDYPLSAAIGQDAAGDPVVAFGTAAGNLLLLDPTSTTATQLSQLSASDRIDSIVAINPIPRIDGTSGAEDYAVADQTTFGDTTGNGALFRWDGTTNPLTPEPVSPGTDTTPKTLLPDLNSFRSWYPGLKEGRFSIANTSGEQISVTLDARPDSGYGCWYAPSWADAPAFPNEAVTVEAGKSSAIYTMGAYTAGPTGACGATDATGNWRAYLTVTPTDRPADVRIIDLELNRDMTVDVKDQAGGSPTVSVSNAHNQMAAFGLWTITVGTPSVPTALSAPTVVGHRLTAPPADPTVADTGAADDPHRPVYRFDVDGAQWSGVGVPGQLTARIPAMSVEGSTDGTHWTNLGALMPATTPTMSGTTVTLGKASFYWQDDPNTQPTTDVRVLSGGLVSNVVHLADLAPPPTNGGPNAAALSGISLTSTKTPRADGLDQEPLGVGLVPANAGGLISTSDPRYGLVYYRYATSNELVTGLFTQGDYEDYVSIAPWRGAYPNDGLQATHTTAAAKTTATRHPKHCPPTDHKHRPKRCSGPGGGLGSGDSGQLNAYLVTTSGVPENVIAEMNDSGTSGGAWASSQIGVQAITAAINVTGYARSGLSLTGCSSNSCSVVAPTTTSPDLYQAGDVKNPNGGLAIGLMFKFQAITSTTILPLQFDLTHLSHDLATTEMTVSGSTAKLSDSSAFWPSDSVDVSLVTAGQLVLDQDVPQQ